MAIKPTTRLKKRYILFSLEGDFGEDELSRAIYLYSLKFFGEYGLSKATIKLISLTEKGGRKEGILLVNRDSLNEVLGMLALISELDRKPARLAAMRTSGTLAALKRKENA